MNTPVTLKYMKKKFTRRTIHFKSRNAHKRGVDYSLPEYTTTRYHDGKVVCNCPGFLQTQHCWHADRVKEVS